MYEITNADISSGKIARNFQFRIPRFSWIDNIKMDLSEIGFERVDYSNVIPTVRAIVNVIITPNQTIDIFLFDYNTSKICMRNLSDRSCHLLHFI